MHAMRGTIAETLGILPIAATLQRTVCEPFEFGDHRFEIGDRVFTAISPTHFLPEYFPEPARFDIDRYSAPRSEHLQQFVYNPFGLGHHACVARGVFEAITIVVVGTMLHHWRLHAGYRMRTIVDALPGPWVRHVMRVGERRRPVTTPAASGPRRPAPSIALPTELLDLLEASPPRRLVDGEVLFREGDRADRVYFVSEGTLRITTRDGAGGDPIVRNVVGPGDVLGEIGVLHGIPRTATATAVGPARLLSVDAASFTRIVLVHGSVDVVVERAGGETLSLARLRAPNCFGEIAMLDERRNRV